MARKLMCDSQHFSSESFAAADDCFVRADSSHVADDVSAHPFLAAMQTLGLPLFLFGASFLLCMTGIMFLLSPDRFPVTIGDRTVLLGDLTAEEQSLLVEKQSLLAESTRLQQLTPTPVLRQLTSLIPAFAPVGRALLSISSLRAGFARDGYDPFHFDSVNFDRQSGKLSLVGSVQDASRPLDILASFVDDLRRDPAILSVTEPEYVQRTIGQVTIAPFSIVLTLALRV